MKEEDFYYGLLVALAIVYRHGAETIAAEIVGSVDLDTLLKAASYGPEPCIRDLRRTIRSLRRARRRGVRV